jgi:hypothetical protein
MMERGSRYWVRVPVDVVVGGVPPIIVVAETANVAVGGALIDMGPLAMGAIVVVAFKIGAAASKFMLGRVVRTQTGDSGQPQVAVMFQSRGNPAATAQWAQFVALLAPASPR